MYGFTPWGAATHATTKRYDGEVITLLIKNPCTKQLVFDKIKMYTIDTK